MMISPAVHQRFWAKVDKNGPVSAHAPSLGQCWLWTGCVLNGYGQFVVAKPQPEAVRHE